MVAGGHAWFERCAWLPGSVHGCGGMHGLEGMQGCWGACMVARGHAWLQGDMCGCWGACMVAGGVCGCWGCAWLQGGMHGCGGHVLQGDYDKDIPPSPKVSKCKPGMKVQPNSPTTEDSDRQQ